MATTPRPKATSTSRTPAETVESRDALYPPRLDQLSLSAEALSGAGPAYSEMLESICGVADDSQPVEQYDGTLGVTQAFVSDHQKPAVQVQWNSNLASVYTNPGTVSGVRWGSGTMISADLMLTCGHLFDQTPNGWTVPRQNGSANAITPQEIATNMRVNVLYQVDPSGVLRTEASFPITQLVEYRLGGLDMAIVRVGGNPGSTYGWTAVAAANAALGDMLAIIGHPAGFPKRIEAGPLTAVTTTQVRYDDIDTLGGNSGSGILQASTGELIGVHTNGGCNSMGTGSNSGTAIAGILAASPTLQALPHGSRTASADDAFTSLAADVHTTSHALDTIAAADQVFTMASFDSPHTLRAADSHTISDILGTHLAADTGWRDQIGTFRAGDVGTIAAGDNPNTWVEGAVDPRFGRDPVLRAGRFGGARPFVQAGPYRPIEGVEQEPSEIEAVLAELANAIAAGQAALTSLETVYQVIAASAGDPDQA